MADNDPTADQMAFLLADMVRSAQTLGYDGIGLTIEEALAVVALLQQVPPGTKRLTIEENIMRAVHARSAWSRQKRRMGEGVGKKQARHEAVTDLKQRYPRESRATLNRWIGAAAARDK